MNKQHLDELIRLEDAKLDKVFEATEELMKIVKPKQSFQIRKTSIEDYEKVIEIKISGGLTAFINIHANSVEASTNQLLHYLFDGAEKTIGFIKEEYK